MNLTGSKVEDIPKGKGARILKAEFQRLLLGCMRSWLNVRIVVPMTDGAQVIGYKDADIKITDQNAVVTLPLMLDADGRTNDGWPPTIYSVATAYSVGDWVWVQATDTITTTGATYPPTGLTAMSKSGLWRCVRTAPAGYFPVAPYPSPDDPTASNMYWLYFGKLFC